MLNEVEKKKKKIKIENTWDKRLITTYITLEYFTYSKLKWCQNRPEELRNDVGKITSHLYIDHSCY